MNKSRIKLLFIVIYVIMLTSRVYAISNIYSFPIESSVVQILYLISLVFIECLVNKKLTIRIRFNITSIIIGLLLLYIFLFGLVFVNPQMHSYTGEMFQRQLLFLMVVISTFLFVEKYNLIDEYIKITYYTLSVILLLNFTLHVSDIKKINVLSIFDVDNRSRASFGLGHYNNLGAICSIVIILFLIMIFRKLILKNEMYLMGFFMVISVIMLLASASRNSIFGVVLFILIILYFKVSKRIKRNLYQKIFLSFFILIVMILIILSIDKSLVENLLISSNRKTLFSVALPTFFESGRTWIGLGLASGEKYGGNLTPYITYWLDNGYIYTLIATGYIGSFLYLLIIMIFFKRLLYIDNKKYNESAYLGIYIIYLFGSLFETTLFNGGNLQNYIYLPLLLAIIKRRK